MKKLVFVLIALVLLSSGCYYMAPPLINTFTADRPVIIAGESVNLSWNVTGATSVIIDPNIGSVPASGSQSVTPITTTAYNLTASNNTGIATRALVITVNPAATKPVIATFEINPSVISPGQTATIRWDVTDATSVKIDPGIGNVPSNGSQTVSPGATTTYTLTASNGSGVVNSTHVVMVSQANPPAILSFYASPSTIEIGEASVLYWNVSGATSVRIEPNIGEVPPSGSQMVSPASTTAYVLTAYNNTSLVTESAVVTVNMYPSSYPNPYYMPYPYYYNPYPYYNPYRFRFPRPRPTPRPTPRTTHSSSYPKPNTSPDTS